MHKQHFSQRSTEVIVIRFLFILQLPASQQHYFEGLVQPLANLRDSCRLNHILYIIKHLKWRIGVFKRLAIGLIELDDGLIFSELLVVFGLAMDAVIEERFFFELEVHLFVVNI